MQLFAVVNKFTSVDNCQYINYVVFLYCISSCKVEQLEPCGFWHRTSSISVSFSCRSRHVGMFADKWSKAVLCSLSTEHAAMTMCPALGRLRAVYVGPCQKPATRCGSSLRKNVDSEGKAVAVCKHEALLVVGRRRQFVFSSVLCRCLQSVLLMSHTIAVTLCMSSCMFLWLKYTCLQ